MTTRPNQRLLSLDVLRGITIAGMLLVNNPGSWGAVYAPLQHAAWNGLTPTDLVFPFFMFIMGVSTYLSLKKHDFRASRTTIWKIVRRTAVIFLVGVAIGWFSRFCGTLNALADSGLPFWERVGQACLNFDRMRILGVMQRLALCYGAAALIGVSVGLKRIPWIAAGLLAAYCLILRLGSGFELSEGNIVAVVDRTVLGEAHMYREGGIPFDPEGLLSTIPAVAHVLIGFCCGSLVAGRSALRDKMLGLFVAGAAMMLAGWLLSYGCPVNKKIWSPSFVLVTCGMASSLLALLVWTIDLKGHRRWCGFFETFGVNPLFLYTTGAVLAILLGNIRLPHGDGTMSLHGFVYSQGLETLLGPYPASLAYALLFVGANWLIGRALYKRKIFIKI